jgi:RHS repeat-associated protein
MVFSMQVTRSGNLAIVCHHSPWGKRRSVNGLSDVTDSLTQTTDRGFTMHEHLDEMGVVHMNGRIYDPLIGRFMSADPILQAPGMLQSHNRYAYVMNNPLNLTDPSGFSAWTRFRDKWLRPIVAIAVAIYAPQFFATYGFAGASPALAGFVNAAGAGFVAGAVSSGTFKGAAQGALTAGLFHGAGLTGPGGGVSEELAARSAERYIAHAAAGCVSSVAGGGSCGQGAASGIFDKFATNNLNFGGVVANGVAAAVAGGVGSVLGGGKFENGAVTGAFGYLFNELSHYKGTSDERLRMGGYEIKDYIRYEQSTGQMYLIDGLTGKEQFLGQGYAGNGFGFNNPDAQNVSNIGPIPEGLYSVGSIRDNRVRIGLPNERVMEASLRLTPITNIGARSGFLIHSDFGVSTASNGCICTPVTVREAVANTGVRRLQVVR